MESTRSKIISDIKIVRKDILYDHPTAGAEIREALAAISGSPGFVLPLAKEELTMTLNDVHLTVANAIRRVVKDEMRGQCLTFDSKNFDRKETTDPYMEDDFIRSRLENMCLRSQISEDVVKNISYRLDVANTTDTKMIVYSGDLIANSSTVSNSLLFNPTYELAVLQPGHTLRIDNIHIIEGFGRQNGAFTVGILSSTCPLDLEELPREQTHPMGAPAAAKSGYVQSSLVSNPRNHKLSVTFPAVLAGEQAALSLMDEACKTIIERLRFVQTVLEAAAQAAAKGGMEGITHRTANASFLITPDGSRTKGVLSIHNETATIGMLLVRLINELSPDIGHVHEEEISHENNIKIVIAHAVSEPEEICMIVLRAIRYAIGIYSQIRSELKQA